MNTAISTIGTGVYGVGVAGKIYKCGESVLIIKELVRDETIANRTGRIALESVFIFSEVSDIVLNTGLGKDNLDGLKLVVKVLAGVSSATKKYIAYGAGEEFALEGASRVAECLDTNFAFSINKHSKEVAICISAGVVIYNNGEHVNRVYSRVYSVCVPILQKVISNIKIGDITNIIMLALLSKPV